MEVVPKTGVLDPQLSDDTPIANFVKLTEDHRRERQRLMDAGDETVALKFQKPQPQRSQPAYNSGGSAGPRYGGPSAASPAPSYGRGPPPPAPAGYSRAPPLASSRAIGSRGADVRGSGAPAGYGRPGDRFTPLPAATPGGRAAYPSAT